jgi:hypothetical protein
LVLAGGIGAIFSYIPDIIGMVFFGFWILMRSQEAEKEIDKDIKKYNKEISRINRIKKTIKTAKKVFEAIKKFEKKIKQRRRMRRTKTTLSFFKFLLSALGELIPLFGALPFWTIFVVFELKESKS